MLVAHLSLSIIVSHVESVGNSEHSSSSSDGESYSEVDCLVCVYIRILYGTTLMYYHTLLCNRVCFFYSTTG